MDVHIGRVANSVDPDLKSRFVASDLIEYYTIYAMVFELTLHLPDLQPGFKNIFCSEKQSLTC